MSVDLFGRHLTEKKDNAARGLPGIGFNLTEAGDFDIGGKKLCNVADPTEDHEAANLATLKREIRLLNDQLQNTIALQKNFINELRLNVGLLKPKVEIIEALAEENHNSILYLETLFVKEGIAKRE